MASISSSPDVVVAPGDAGALVRAAQSGARVILLEGGTYSISGTIKLTGQQLIGATGQNVVIDAAGVDKAFLLDSNAVLANVAVVRAENEGVQLVNSSLVYRVSAGRTGYGPIENVAGLGFVVTRGGANNCLVSVEAYEGFNEDGDTCAKCFNGGNADGIAIKFGAHTNTMIDAHAYRNSDDGYDFWEAGTNYVYFGSSFDNGELPNRRNGDGNGVKLGRGEAPHYLYKTSAFSNVANGFDLNGNLIDSVLVSTSAQGNGGQDYAGVRNR